MTYSARILPWLVAGTLGLASLGISLPSFAQQAPGSTARVATANSLPKVKYVVRGKDFQILRRPQRDDPNYTDVVMFFWYGSPWSAQVEPILRDWVEQGRAPANLRLTLVPIVLDEEWAFAARIFYALEQLNQERVLTPKFLQAVNRKQVDLSSPVSVKNWMELQGVSAEEFEKAINGPKVIARTTTLVPIAQQYEVRSTPTFVIDGRYHISAHEQMSPARAVAVAMFMADQLSKGGPRP